VGATLASTEGFAVGATLGTTVGVTLGAVPELHAVMLQRAIVASKIAAKSFFINGLLCKTKFVCGTSLKREYFDEWGLC
jgi:hypothetical protein